MLVVVGDPVPSRAVILQLHVRDRALVPGVVLIPVGLNAVAKQVLVRGPATVLSIRQAVDSPCPEAVLGFRSPVGGEIWG